MQVATITMPKEVARQKLKAFRADRHKDSEAMYAAAAEAYKHLAEGTVLLSLRASLEVAGRFASDSPLPKLAIARSDRREVKCTVRQSTATFNTSFAQRYGRVARDAVVDVPLSWNSHWIDRYALVPMVPADVRPKHGQLRDFFTLWEVERWFERPQSMKAPIDPMLLKHLGGDLYAVVAQWDLTAVERLILEGAMRS